jgi:hypothetical protein
MVTLWAALLHILLVGTAGAEDFSGLVVSVLGGEIENRGAATYDSPRSSAAQSGSMDISFSPASGTLIGHFITSTGIVIGADGAVSDGKALLPGADKTCQTSPKSIATIQGQYGIPLPLPPPHNSVLLFNHFKSKCAALFNLAKHVALKEQADILIEELRSTLQVELGNFPPGDLAKGFSKNPHVNYVSVSGYVDGVPHVFVRELRLVQTKDGQWNAIAYDASQRSPEPCGVAFNGERKIAVELMQGYSKIIPQREFLRDEVIAGIVANRTRDCSSFTQEQAWKLFETAVALTIQYGDKVGIHDGHVGGKLTCWSITPAGGAAPCKNAKQ